MKTILEDKRDIKQLQVGDGEYARYYTVDDDEETIFTKIVPYIDQDGALMFAVYDGQDEPRERIRFTSVSNVIYFKERT